MAETHTRQAKRTPVTLKIKFKSSTLDQFIERYSVDVSHGGIFIRTKDPLAVGTSLRFEFQLKDASPLIRGEGTVVWTREHDPSRSGVAPGMGVRFDRLAEGSQQVLDKILAQKAKTGSKTAGKNPGFNEAPTKVAPSPLLAGLNKEGGPKLGNLAPKSDSFGSSSVEHTGTDATPLPSPMPFHSDADDFPEEAFEEATKVASLDALAAKSIRDDVNEADDNLDEVEPVFKEPPLTREELEAAEAEAAEAEAAKAKPVDELAERRKKKTTDDEETAATSLDDEVTKQRPAANKAEAKKAEATTDAEPDKKAKAEPETKAKAKAKAEPEKKAKAEPDKKPKADAPKSKADKDKRDRDSATATATEAPEEKSSGLIYALVAAIVLVVGGGAYYYMSQDKGEQVASGPAPTEGPATAENSAAATEPTPAPVAEEPVVEPPAPEPPPVETFAVNVEVEPAGATVEVIDGEHSGTAPASFDLEKNASHKLRISAPGYLPQEVEVAEAKPEIAVALTAKPRVLRITSEPEGAKVTIKGRAVKGRTPVDVPVNKRMQRDKLPVVIAMRGYKSEKLTASGVEGFVEEDDVMVQEISANLDKLVAARSTTRSTSASRSNGSDKSETSDKSGDTKTAKADTKKTDTKKTDPKKTDSKSADKSTDTEKTDTKTADKSTDTKADTATATKADAKKTDTKKTDTKTADKSTDGQGTKTDKPKDDGPSGPQPDWMK